MHMSDGLLSPQIAITAGVAAAALIGVAAAKVRKMGSDAPVALMGVMGAFVFAAQMLNFSIPGTGSSGHIIGGVLLAALLGPWAAFLVLSAVLVIQCLVFADGGLMALGCNIVNMAALSCLVAYPLVFKPIVHGHLSASRIMWGSVAACVCALSVAAFFVTFETELSGITLLPVGKFLMFMFPVHVLIGLAEGLATGGVLCFILKARPELFHDYSNTSNTSHTSRGVIAAVGVFAALAIIFSAFVSRYASSNPDGLEWSIEKVTGSDYIAPSEGTMMKAEKLQASIASDPGYTNHLSGIAGTCAVVMVIGSGCALLKIRTRKNKEQ